MKIITWNCNMAFRKKWAPMVDLKPDLLIIQECENESKYKAKELIPGYNEFVWVGDNINKGVGILSFNDYHVEVMPEYNTDFKYIIPLKVTGAATFNLLAIWAMPDKDNRSKSYVGQIWHAIDYYKKLLNEPCILIGDWNSNVLWDKERKVGNHTQVVNFLKQYNIDSVYHELNTLEHGAEQDPTLYLLKKQKKPYHMDYVFTTSDMITAQTSIEVGKYDEWIKLSDHMPVVVDGLKVE